MKKNKIRLTESKLYQVIKESVKRILVESYPNPMGGPESRINPYPEYAKDFDEDEPLLPIPNKERLHTLDRTTDAFSDWKKGDNAYFEDGEVYPSAEWSDTNMYGEPNHYSEWSKEADDELNRMEDERFKNNLDREWDNTKELEKISKMADSRPLHRKGSLNRAMDESIRRTIRKTLKSLNEKKSWSEMTDDERKKDNENWQSWQDLRHMYDNGGAGYYYDQTKNGEGYADEWEIPDEELEMYKSMGNPSQYATKEEGQKWVRNKSGYGNHRTPERYEDGSLAISALSEPKTYRQLYGDNDDSEASTRYVNSAGENRMGTRPSYAKNPANFMGNQDMHDLENNRIAQANFDALHELDYLNTISETKIRNIINKNIKKFIRK